MAIKISGTTVIDDSRNVTNVGTFTATTLVGDGSGLTNLPLPTEVLQPTNTSPTNNSTTSGLTPTLTGSDYISLYDKAHTCSCFDVSTSSGFGTCAFTCEILGACTSLAVPASCLSGGTQYFFRLRYEDADGTCSAFSATTCFCTPDLPQTLGESTCGGYYTGTITVGAQSYYLIVAPNSSGCACCQWKTVRTYSEVSNEPDQLDNGYNNTYSFLNSSTFPAGNFTATRTIGGFSDWYLPAKNELTQLYTNKGSMPAGEGYCDSGGLASVYWNSSEHLNNGNACVRYFSNGVQFETDVTCSYRLRAVRRVPFP